MRLYAVKSFTHMLNASTYLCALANLPRIKPTAKQSVNRHRISCPRLAAVPSDPQTRLLRQLVKTHVGLGDTYTSGKSLYKGVSPTEEHGLSP